MKRWTQEDLDRQLQNSDVQIVDNAPPLWPNPSLTFDAPNEAKLQERICSESARRAHTFPVYDCLYAIPNGEYRTPATAGKLKMQGVKPGVPDLCLAAPSRGYHGLYVELKVKKKKPSAKQNEWLDRLSKQGYYVAVIYDRPSRFFALVEWYLDANNPDHTPEAAAHARLAESALLVLLFTLQMGWL